MLQIVYYNVKDKFFDEIGSYPAREVIFVTPSPAKADSLRANLENNSVEVITIAKFTANLFKVLFRNKTLPEIKRKADLLLILGILKNKYLPNLGYEQFIQAYNLFSDLRSFTLDLDALSVVLEEQTVEIRQAVQMFWQIMEMTGFLDEHGAYQKITEELRSSEEEEEIKKTFIFWGFQHLNGQQVDLLRALAIRYSVIIPLPHGIREKLKFSDWPTWLQGAGVEERECLGIIEKRPKGNWLKINSREISFNLKNNLKAGDQVVLGVSRLAADHMDIIPSGDVKFKIPVSLVGPEIEEVSLKLKEILLKKKELNLEVMEKTLLTMRRESAKEKKYRTIKVVELYQDVVNLIKDLTDEELNIDIFFLRLIRDVVSLNQPRTSFVPVGKDEKTISLFDMSSLSSVRTERRVLFCIDDRHEDIFSLGQNYTEVIHRALSTLGPIKRNELELNFRSWEFKEIFSKNDVVVLMPDSVLKHRLAWKKLFAGIELELKENNLKQPEKIICDSIGPVIDKSFAGSFSASKLQAFVDCPRKFYFSYVDKIFPSIERKNDFDSLISGTIIHEIIEKYHKRLMDQEKLEALVEEIMLSYVKKLNLKISEEAFLQKKLVFRHRSENGLRFLEGLEKVLGEKINWEIEKEFNLVSDYSFKGKIDCLGISSKYIFLLDFKSTMYSASTNKEVEDFESYQLWSYATVARKIVPDFSKRKVVIGYAVLDSTEDSNLLLDDDGLFEILKPLKKFKIKKTDRPFSEMLDVADEKIRETITQIVGERKFPASPRKSSVCTFCELNKICLKRNIDNV